MRRFIFLTLTLFSLSGCSETEINEDMDRYCACISQEKDGALAQKCVDQKNEIVRKYEFDPKAAEIIKKRLAECSR